MSKKGSLICIVAPSGAGKTTLVRALRSSVAGLQVSISTTTRPMRPDDQEGVDYFFVTREEFLSQVEAAEFLEHAEVYGHLYGTSKKWVEQRLEEGLDVVLEIDWQGAALIKAIFPDAINIFIVPPTLCTLRSRLVARGQDTDEVIAARLAQAMDDMSHCLDQDYVVVNDDLEQALSDLKQIIGASRLRTEAVGNQLQNMLAELEQNG